MNTWDLRWNVVALVFLLLVITGCSTKPQLTQEIAQTESGIFPTKTATIEPEEEVAPTPYIARLEVFPDQHLQIIKDVGGGNFIHRYGGADTPFEPVSEMNIAMLTPFMARVSLDLDVWEPVNDNDDPFSFDKSKFIDEPGSIVHNTLEFIQQFQRDFNRQAGEEQVLIASIWYVPDWMVSNPEFDRARSISDEMIPEVIESIAAWLLYAREEYGVEVEYVSFNEANLGVNVLLSGDAYAQLIIQAGERFAELGLETRWLLADTSSMSEAPSYAQRIYSNQETHPYLGPLSFHSWDMTSSDSALIKIADFADENNLETWCTEGGWNSNMWQTRDDFPTFRNALNQAVIYSRVLKLTRATSLMYWEMMGADYSMNDGQKPYPILEFMAELKKQFPPGSQIVETAADTQSVKYVAALVDGEIVLLITNRNPIAENAVLTGLPEGTYSLVRSDKTGMNRSIATYEMQGEPLEFEIAPSSINFLTTRP